MKKKICSKGKNNCIHLKNPKQISKDTILSWKKSNNILIMSKLENKIQNEVKICQTILG